MRTTFILPALLHSICVLSAPAPIPNPNPAPYIVTQYIELSVAYTVSARTRSTTTIPQSVVEYVATVSPLGTPTNALSTVTDSTSWAEVTVIEIHLPPGTAPKKTPEPYIYDASATAAAASTSFFIPVTYTPMASCISRYPSQSWILTTNIPISIPSLVRTALTPLTTIASTSTYTNYNDKLSRITQQIAILNPTDIPGSVLAKARSLYEPAGISGCYTPTTTCYTLTRAAGVLEATCRPTFAYDSYGRTTTLTPTSGSNPNSNFYPYGYGYPSRPATSLYILLIVILVPIAWLILFFVLGLFESWFSFKGLMHGKQRKRGTPYLWCCITCFSLCCVGPTYKAKSAEEQVVLAERWKELKLREKLGLWLKWGFRWKYPDCLGEAPEVDRRALRERCL